MYRGKCYSTTVKFEGTTKKPLDSKTNAGGSDRVGLRQRQNVTESDSERGRLRERQNVTESDMLDHLWP